MVVSGGSENFGKGEPKSVTWESAGRGGVFVLQETCLLFPYKTFPKLPSKGRGWGSVPPLVNQPLIVLHTRVICRKQTQTVNDELFTKPQRPYAITHQLFASEYKPY